MEKGGFLSMQRAIGNRATNACAPFTAEEFGSVATLSTNGELEGKYDSSVFSGLEEPDELEPQPATTGTASSKTRATPLVT